MVITEKEYLKVNLSRLRSSISFIFALFWAIITLFLINSLSSFNLQNLIYLFLSFLLYLVFLTILFYAEHLSLIFGLIFSVSGSLFFFLSLFFKATNEFAAYIALIYGILLIGGYFLFKNFDKNSLKINWLHSFKTLWNINALFFLIVIFIFLSFYFDFSQIKKEQIENLLDKSKSLFEILNLGITPDSKIEDVILRNINVQLDETTKKEAVTLSINEINKKYNLNLKPESTIKEAIAQYLKNQTSAISNQQKGLNFNKLFIIIILILILNSLFHILGSISSFLSLIPFYFLKKIKLFETESEPVYKEKIKF